MPLIKNGYAADNPWIALDDEQVFADQEYSIIPLNRYIELYDDIEPSNAPLGVSLSVGDDVIELKDKLDKIDLVTVDFPSFADGRGFSQSRLLRERLGFEGEIRAVGHIIRDQFLYLLRSGVNSIDTSRASEDEWKTAMEEFDTFYQPALTQGVPAYLLRHEEKAVAAE